MHIEQEEISALYECQACKRTFAGYHAQLEATIHARSFEHIVTGKSTYFISIIGKRNA